MDDSKTHPGKPLSSLSAEEDNINRRRSTRLLVAVPVTISGQNARGEAFREEARTIVINRQGASIATSQPLVPGSEITVENPPLRMAVRAHVTRFLEKTSSTGFHQIGVELMEPKNIWGIKYPPADWQRASSGTSPGQAAPAQTQLSGSARIKPTAQPTSFTVDLPPEVARQKPTASPSDSHAADLDASKSSNFAELKGSIDAQIQAGLYAAARHLEEKEAALRSLDQKLADAAGRAEKSAFHLEELVSKIEEARRQTPIETEQARKSVQEAVEAAFQSIRRDMDKNLSQSLEFMRSGFLEETRRIAAEQVSALSQEFKQEIGGSLSGMVAERLSATTSELEARQSRTLEDTQERMGGLLSASLENFQQQLQQGAQSLRESTLSNMAQEGAARVALEYESKTAKAAEEAGAQARQIIGSALGDFHAQLQKSAEDLRKSTTTAIAEESAAKTAAEIQARQAEIAGQAEAQVQTAMRAELEGFQAQLQKSAEDLRKSTATAIAEESAAKAAAEIQARQAEIAGQAEAQVQTAMRAALEGFQAQLQKSAEDLRKSTAMAIAEESAAKAFAEIQARQAEITGQAEAQIHTAVRAELEGFQAQLQKSAEDLRKSTATAIAEESAAKAVAEIQARQVEIARQIETHIRTALQSGSDAIQTRIQQAEQTFRDSILPTLTQECVEKSIAAAETSQSALVERTQSQMQSIMLSSAEGFKAESERAAKQFRELVLPGLAAECAAASTEEMRQAQREAIQQTAEHIQGALQSALSGFGEQLRSSEQALKEQAEELLRLPAQQINQYAEDTVTLVREGISSLRAGQVEAAQSQLAAMTRGALTSMTEEVKATMEEYRNQLRAIFEGLRERSTAAVESYIKEALDHSRESVMQQLQKDAEDFSTVAVAQFRSRSGEAVQEATEAIHKQVGSAAFVVKDWLDQAGQQMDARLAKLEARSESALEAIDHRSQDLSRVVLDKFQKESETVLASLRLRIQNAVKALDAPEPAIPSTEVHSESPARQPQEFPVPSDR